MYTGNLACAKACHHCVLESHYRLHTGTAQAIAQRTKSVTRQKALASCSHCSIHAVLQCLRHHLSHLVPRTECSLVKCMLLLTIQIFPENSEEKNCCCHSQLLQFRINQSTSDSRTKKNHDKPARCENAAYHARNKVPITR